MTDKENLLRFNFRGSYDDLIPVENGELVRAFDYEALAAKLAEAEAMIEAQQKDYASNNVRFAEAEYRAKVAEAALPAAYRLALGDAEFACTNVIKNYDVTYDGGKKFAPIKTQNAAKGMVSIAREDICALPTPTAAELMARINAPKPRSSDACDSCGYNVQKPCKTKADRQNCEFAP